MDSRSEQCAVRGEQAWWSKAAARYVWGRARTDQAPWRDPAFVWERESGEQVVATAVGFDTGEGYGWDDKEDRGLVVRLVRAATLEEALSGRIGGAASHPGMEQELGDAYAVIVHDLGVGYLDGRQNDEDAEVVALYARVAERIQHRAAASGSHADGRMDCELCRADMREIEPDDGCEAGDALRDERKHERVLSKDWTHEGGR